MKETRNFTTGPVLPALLKFAVPVFGAMLLQNTYGAVDMMVVGQFAQSADVSAVSTGSWLMWLVMAFVCGISMGLTIILGYKIGEGKPEEAGKFIGASMTMFLIMGIIVTVLLECFAEQLAGLLQTPPEAFEATVTYVRICAAGSLFIIAYNVLGAVFRGIGDSKMPLITVAIASVVNIIGDLVLIAGFGMATAGAAIATVGAQAVSVIISLIIIRRRQLPFAFSVRYIRLDAARIRQVFLLGLPIAFQDVLVNISFLTITAIVNSLGVIASAGVGVAQKLCGFIMLVPSSLGQSMSAFVAQNMGAGKQDRAGKALFYGISFSFAVGVVMGGLSFFRGDLMSSLFSSDVQVIAASVDYLKSYAIDCLFVAFLFCMTGYFSGCEKTFFVMIQGIVGAFCVRIPVSFFMSRIEPVSLFRVGLATPASTVVQILLCLSYFVWLRKKSRKLQNL